MNNTLKAQRNQPEAALPSCARFTIRYVIIARHDALQFARDLASFALDRVSIRLRLSRQREVRTREMVSSERRMNRNLACKAMQSQSVHNLPSASTTHRRVWMLQQLPRTPQPSP